MRTQLALHEILGDSGVDRAAFTDLSLRCQLVAHEESVGLQFRIAREMECEQASDIETVQCLLVVVTGDASVDFIAIDIRCGVQ